MVDGPFNAESFVNFLNSCEKKNVFTPRRVIIMDNLRVHHTQVVENFFTDRNYSKHFLPTYSPQINPIEEVFL